MEELEEAQDHRIKDEHSVRRVTKEKKEGQRTCPTAMRIIIVPAESTSTPSPMIYLPKSWTMSRKQENPNPRSYRCQ